MSGIYAAKTEVSVQRSRNELEATLKRYGASAINSPGRQWPGRCGILCRPP